MKCGSCGSEKLRAVNFDNLDYIYYQVNDKWVLSNPTLGYFHNSRKSFSIDCTECREYFKHDGELDNQYSPAINHKEITLDLDHTLIYVDYFLEINNYDFKFKDPDSSIEYRVFKRNGLDKFIKALAKRFDKINFFTAATDWYAKSVIDQLNIPEDKLGFIKTRKDTFEERDLSFEKELMKIMNNSLVVEDKPLVIKGYNNTIFKVKSFYPNPKDKELSKIIKLLKKTEKKLEKSQLVSGSLFLFLKSIDIKLKNLPTKIIDQIIKINIVSQEEINKSKIHMKIFESNYNVYEDIVSISIIDLSYDSYLKLFDLVKDYTSHKKISQKNFSLLIEKKHKKRFSDF